LGCPQQHYEGLSITAMYQSLSKPKNRKEGYNLSFAIITNIINNILSDSLDKISFAY